MHFMSCTKALADCAFALSRVHLVLCTPLCIQPRLCVLLDHAQLCKQRQDLFCTETKAAVTVLPHASTDMDPEMLTSCRCNDHAPHIPNIKITACVAFARTPLTDEVHT